MTSRLPFPFYELILTFALKPRLSALRKRVDLRQSMVKRNLSELKFQASHLTLGSSRRAHLGRNHPRRKWAINAARQIIIQLEYKNQNQETKTKKKIRKRG